jgi:hypothetical protein
VVIHDFYIVGSIVPSKADPVSIIDPDAVLPCPIIFQGFKVVPRRDRQHVQF